MAQATQEAIFTGVLSPEFEVGDTPGIITSQALGDSTVEFPTLDSGGGAFNSGDIQIVSAPNTNSSSGVHGGVGTLAAGNYQYKVTWFTNSAGTPDESAPSAAITVNGVLLNESVDLSNLPVDVPATSIWDGRRVYRSTDGGVTFNQLGPDLDLTTTTFTDDGSLAVGAALDNSVLDQQEYSYYVTYFSNSNGTESRPTTLIGPYPISDSSSRIRIDNIPQPTSGAFDEIHIYRNLGNNTSEFHLVDVLPLGTTTYIDSMSDTSISGNQELDPLGAKATSTTLLTDVVILSGDEYIQPFQLGTLSFAGTKGGRTLVDQGARHHRHHHGERPPQLHATGLWHRHRTARWRRQRALGRRAAQVHLQSWCRE